MTKAAGLLRGVHEAIDDHNAGRVERENIRITERSTTHQRTQAAEQRMQAQYDYILARRKLARRRKTL